MIPFGIPMSLGARAWLWFDGWTNRRCCQSIGHEYSWAHGVSVGYPRPVCTRCGHEAGRKT